jgi:hypothetical protein
MKRFQWGGWALLGGVLGLFSGTLPDAVESRRENAREATASNAAAPASRGYGIDGDGFYVWDEDRREAEDWAIELAGPAFPSRRS